MGRSSSQLALLVGVVTLVGVGVGCPFTTTNEEHCAARDGDATCAAVDPSRPFCALDGCGLYDEVKNVTGCVAERPESAACHSPCGGTQSADVSGVCSTGTSTTSTTSMDSTSDMDASSSTAATTQACDCMPGEPCVDGTCTPCEDDEICVSEFAGEREHCVLGTCQSCSPNASTTVGDIHVHHGCDASAPNCVDGACGPACLFPEDCPQTGCNLGTNLCGAPARTWFVRTGVMPSDENDGMSADTSLASISEAIQRAASSTETAIIMLGDHTFNETLTFASGSFVLRPHVPGVEVSLHGATRGEPLLSLPEPSEGQTNVNLVGLDVGPGHLVARVGRNARLFVDATDMRGSLAGFEIDGGAVFLRNSILADSNGAVVRFTSQGTFSAVGSTLLENQAGNDTDWFLCDGMSANSEIVITGSIVGVFDDEAPSKVQCPNASFIGLVATECSKQFVVSECNAVQGLATGDFGKGRRLEVGANPVAYGLDPTDLDACSVSATSLAAPSLCPSRVDIDGESRETRMNRKGADVPQKKRTDSRR